MKGVWKSLGAGAALILLLTVVAYVPALRGGFVYDDHQLITENRMVQASGGLYQFWFTTKPGDYYPLTWSLWWLEWRAWDGRAMGYHVVNVLLHAANAVLLWLILRRLKIPGAWVAGMVFAVHPVNVATVAWISEQKNTLSMLFCALAVLLYLRFDEDRRWHWYGWSLAAFLLALLSKTAVVMLPVALLGCVWWLRGRVRRKDVLCCAPFFVLSLALALVTIWFQRYRALEGHTVRTIGFASRLAEAGLVPWFYLYKALLPVGLTVLYPKWEIDPARWISYVPGVVLLGCFWIFWWKRKTWGRPLLFGLGYFVVMLFPVLGFFDQGFYYYTLVADHWQYYSIIGVIALAVAAAERVGARLGRRGWYFGTVAAVAVVAVLGVATWKRGSVYADEETLWRDNVAKNPTAWAAYNNLGVALRRAGRIQEAITRYQVALRINPDVAAVHDNLGVALELAGKINDAIGHYEQAVRIEPDDVEAHYDFGNALREAGKATEAIGQYEQALKIKPDFAEAENNLGIALAQTGNLQDAIGHYRRALRLMADYAEAHYNLGVALARLGQVPEAVGHLEEALRLRPDYAEVHYNLGLVLAREGRVPEAIAHWEQALKIKPDYAEVHVNLGIASERAGRAAEAIGHYEEALRLKPRYAEAHYNLGIALERSGRVTEAIAHYEQALRIRPGYAEAHNNLGSALAAQGRMPEAISHWEEALRINPDYARAYYNLGMALEQSGRLSEAKQQYEQALRINPRMVDAQSGLGRLRTVR
ncbi:MAG TPA: tetratricopeptide repeat protein [Verrucomicrobiae bacterium]|nr:tetratricopeptide repeat protein [Verrucomicrobiae bacterium]